MSDKCPLCGDTGYSGTDAYGERVRCKCRQEAATRDREAPDAVTDAFSRGRILILQPGDRVVLEYPGVLSAEAAERLRGRFQRWLNRPDVDVAVLEAGTTLKVVRGQS